MGRLFYFLHKPPCFPIDRRGRQETYNSQNSQIFALLVFIFIPSFALFVFPNPGLITSVRPKWSLIQGKYELGELNGTVMAGLNHITIYLSYIFFTI